MEPPGADAPVFITIQLGPEVLLTPSLPDQLLIQVELNGPLH
jgi:hypothetical protein